MRNSQSTPDGVDHQGIRNQSTTGHFAIDEAPAPSITYEIEVIDNDTAITYLGLNFKNRPAKRAATERYCADMRAGRWTLNGEAIKFDEKGELLDGQNRLNALILANELEKEREITFTTLVIRGLPRSTQDSMDGPVPRSVSDQFAMRGRPKYAKLAAAVRIVAAYDDKTMHLEKANPRMRLIELYESDAEAFDQYNSEETDFVNTSDINTSVLVAAKYILLRRVGADSAAVEEFFHKVKSGEDLPKGSPILSLRIRMHNAKIDRVRSRNNQTCLLILRTWNAWRKNDSMKKIQLRNPQGEVIIPATIEQ